MKSSQESTLSTGLEAGSVLSMPIAGVETRFRWSPPGKFVMGSPADEPDRAADETAHEVELTRGFWLAETATTQALWRAVMGSNPSAFQNELNPVESVSWRDCQAFVDLIQNYAPDGYWFRLPTEAEWEYSCRAGASSAFSCGDRLPLGRAHFDGSLTFEANYLSKYRDYRSAPTHPLAVGSFPANSWGYFDMHGNVWEWCADRYDGDYGAEPKSDPQGAALGWARVLRGGSWRVDAGDCRSASRWNCAETIRSDDLGFRLALGELVAGAVRTVVIAGVPTRFRYCPPGTFTMGSPEDEEGRYADETQHEVTLTRGFWLAETPTTQELWKAVMESNPRGFEGDNLPVETVSWYDCRDFIERIQEDAPKGLKFSLPTEAQWEYACRAGTTTPFSFGSTLNGDKANCRGNYPYGTNKKGQYLEKTSPVGSYPPNAWGLYDMHGNVWEWCSDWYGDYPNEAATDPTGTKNGSDRVLRGGGWNYTSRNCRSASRNRYTPGYRYFNLGFRLELIDASMQSSSDSSRIRESGGRPRLKRG